MALDEKPQYDLATELAKLTVMRHIVATVVSNHTGEMWEDYPEIGENDWIEITERLRHIHTFPVHTEFRTAYQHLAARADH